MDKASAHGAADCRFEFYQDHMTLSFCDCREALASPQPKLRKWLEVLGTQRFLTAPEAAEMAGSSGHAEIPDSPKRCLCGRGGFKNWGRQGRYIAKTRAG